MWTDGAPDPKGAHCAHLPPRHRAPQESCCQRELPARLEEGSDGNGGIKTAVTSITIHATICGAPTMPGTGLRVGTIPHLHSSPSKLGLSLVCNSKIQKLPQTKDLFSTILVAKPVCSLSPCSVNGHRFCRENTYVCLQVAAYYVGLSKIQKSLTYKTRLAPRASEKGLETCPVPAWQMKAQ